MSKEKKISVLDIPTPDKEEFEDIVKMETDDRLTKQTDKFFNAEYDEKRTPTEEDGEMVSFVLNEQSNDRFRNPLAITINGAKIDIPRGTEMSAPRCHVAAAERHYIVSNASGRHPATGARLKRKVRDRLYENVVLLPHKTTGRVAKIDTERQKALRKEVAVWKATALKEAVLNQ